MEWNFGVLLKQPVTHEQADAFDHCDALADGAISYTLAPDDPDAHPHAVDPVPLHTLNCDIDAPTLLDAVAEAVRRIRFVDGLRAVGVSLPATVTLDEAAQRSGLGVRALGALSREPRFPDPVSVEGTVFYDWDRVAAFLRDVGESVPDVPRDLAIAEHALRLADALDGAEVPPGLLRALGLPTP
ncbi:hypothetical protein [Streptomyces phytohabitans]|uniref:hypothetical protein n=1 Tax=Streptomyces phytohabitans TaxID=1150371 RepID=UPI00345BC4D9